MSREIVESEEFYNLMQFYRHMPIVRQKEVVKAYEEVKAHVESLQAKERKKVRERCAEWMEHSVDRGCSGVVGECSCGLEQFLQLDLTKDLAASSREEKENG